MDVIEKKRLAHWTDGIQVIIFDRIQARKMIDWVDTKKGVKTPAAIGEFHEWAMENLVHHWTLNWVDIDPSLVRHGDVELEYRRRKFRLYAERHYRPDIDIPDTIRRWAVNFADEMDALHFKMRWIG